MTLSDEIKEELRFWADLPAGLCSPITLGQSKGTVTTDASDTGLGIHFNGHVILKEISSEYIGFHINLEEFLIYFLK